MKKILIVNGLILLLALVVGGTALGDQIDYKGYPDKLEIQLAKIEVSQDGGDTWTTIWEGTSSTLDCATQATSYLVTGIKMAAGDYNGIRLSFHDSVVKGAVTVDPATDFLWATNGGGNEIRYYFTHPTDDGTNYTTVDLGTAQGLAQDETIGTSGSTMAIYRSEPPYFTISHGQTATIELLFGLTNALNYTVDFTGTTINWQGFTWGLPAGFDVT